MEAAVSSADSPGFNVVSRIIQIVGMIASPASMYPIDRLKSGRPSLNTSFAAHRKIGNAKKKGIATKTDLFKANNSVHGEWTDIQTT